MATLAAIAAVGFQRLGALTGRIARPDRVRRWTQNNTARVSTSA